MEAITGAQGARSAERELAGVVKQFQDWRLSRRKIERIPEELWQAATALYPRYNVCQIAHALRMNFVALRERIHSAGKGSRRPKPKAVARAGSENDGLHFLELPVEAAGAVEECSVKVKEGRFGKRISIRVKGARVGQLLQTLRTLWSQAQ